MLLLKYKLLIFVFLQFCGVLKKNIDYNELIWVFIIRLLTKAYKSMKEILFSLFVCLSALLVCTKQKKSLKSTNHIKWPNSFKLQVIFVINKNYYCTV